MNHQNLNEHVFITEFDTSNFVCRICGFTLTHLDCKRFNISLLDLFFDEKPKAVLSMPTLSANLKKRYDNVDWFHQGMAQAESKLRKELSSALFKDVDKLICSTGL